MPSRPGEVAIAELDGAGVVTGRLWEETSDYSTPGREDLRPRWVDESSGKHKSFRRLSSYREHLKTLRRLGCLCDLVVWIHPDHHDKPLGRYQGMKNQFPGSPRR